MKHKITYLEKTGDRFRKRRNHLLRKIRTPLYRYVYNIRGGWQAECILRIAQALSSFTSFSFIEATRLHFLYILNRHDTLKDDAWRVVLGDEKFRRNHLSLHMLLKSAWVLQDKALLAIVLDAIKKRPLSNNNFVYLSMRKSADPEIMYCVIQAAVRAKTAILGCKINTEADVEQIVEYVRQIDTAELYDVPSQTLTLLNQVKGENVVHRYLAHHAARDEDWKTVFDNFEKARIADPKDPKNYLDLGDTALYFPDPLERINQTLRQRAHQKIKVQGYDKLLGLKLLLETNYKAYLDLRNAQVSNSAAHQTFRDAASHFMGENAPSYKVTDGSAFVIGRDGVSDELRWSYYYGPLQEYYNEVAISCDPRLLGLFQRSFPGINFYPVARNWGRAKVAENEVPRDRVPNMELSSRLDNIAFEASCRADEVMYIEDVPLRNWKTRGIDGPPDAGEPKGATLHPKPERKAYWSRRFAQNGSALNVGLIWRSGLIDLERSRHYITLSDLKGLTGHAASFYSIQHQVNDEERKDAQKLGIKFIDDEVDFYNDFEEIAAATSALDLVIGISTLPYEMAAAVGTDVWLCAISPLGRWMRLGQTDGSHDRLTRNGSVYYPHTKQGFLAPRDERITSIMSQLEVDLADLIERKKQLSKIQNR